jgi:hypothetical protein
MDSVTEYQYAYGGLEDIRKKNLENMDILDSPLDFQIQKVLDEVSRKSLLILPKFLGVYQISELKMQTGEETEHEEGIRNYKARLKQRLDSAGQEILEVEGKTDRFSPELIHVGYDPSLYDKGLMIDLMGENRRIGISPYNKCPDFREKNNILPQFSSNIVST